MHRNKVSHWILLVSSKRNPFVIASELQVHPNVVLHPISLENSFLNAEWKVWTNVYWIAYVQAPVWRCLEDTACPDVCNINFDFAERVQFPPNLPVFVLRVEHT